MGHRGGWEQRGSPGELGGSAGGCRRAVGGRALVHCRMGLSRSAATVLAYAMKEFGWPLERALRHVRHCRPGVLPNPGFMRQLDFYQGILQARWAGQGAGRDTPSGWVEPDVATPLWMAEGGAGCDRTPLGRAGSAWTVTSWVRWVEPAVATPLGSGWGPL